MKTPSTLRSALLAAVAGGALLCLPGCSTVPKDYVDPEGVSYQNASHEIRIQVADGFDFGSYEALCVLETKSSVQPEEKPDEAAQFKRLLEVVRRDFATQLAKAGITPFVTTEESALPAGAKALGLENTVVGYYRGSAAERVLIGFGAGSPYLMVRGKLTDRATGEAKAHFLVKRGFEGMDRGIDDEGILSGNTKDMAVDVADVLKRVKDHRPLK